MKRYWISTSLLVLSLVLALVAWPGSSLASPQDFDGDGYCDLAIGVPYENVGSTTDAGSVSVIYGTSSGLTGTADEYLQNKITQGTVYGLGKFFKTTDILPLSRLVDQSSIILNMKLTEQGAVLHELAQAAHETGAASSVDRLVLQLQKRENLLTTAIGHGVAIPHPRNPSDEIFKKPYVVIARSKKGVDFAAPDGMKVHLFFLTCAPDVILHLKLLSKVASLLNVKDAYKKFMKATTKAEMLKVIMKTERINIKSPKQT